MYDFGFIGTGNMGGAIAEAVCKAVEPKNVLLSDKSPEKSKALAEKLGASLGDNTDVAEKARYIVLGVKPQMMEETLRDIKNQLKNRESRFVIVTMAAGIKMEFYSEILGENYPIIRIMPNIPVSIGMGTTVYCANEAVKESEKTEFALAMEKSGIIRELPEKLIDAASAVSGSGPAFVYMFAESLADGAVKCGLPRDTALKLAAQTIMGAGAMVLDGSMHPGQLKDAVCSPGGTTIEGVHSLERGGFRGIVMDAVEETYIKNFNINK